MKENKCHINAQTSIRKYLSFKEGSLKRSKKEFMTVPDSKVNAKY